MIGRYRIKGVLADGALATVLRCFDPLLRRDVAVYRFKESLAEDLVSTDLDRFRNGISLLANLQHPNIVNVHDAGVDDHHPYHVLELITGKSIRELVSQEIGVGSRVAVKIMIQVAGAVQYMHESGIVHRVLTPANVVLRSSGEPVIVGFTNAAAAQFSLLARGTEIIYGKCAEQDTLSAELTGKVNGECSSIDIRGIGVTLFSAIVGQRSEIADTVTELRERTLAGLADASVKIPSYLKEIIERCLEAGNPGGYRSADMVKRALEASIRFLEMDEGSEAPSAALPVKGQSILLHVEYQEANKPGAFREYKIEDRVSEGSYGVVYKASKADEDSVAVKILKQKWVADQEAVIRFRREAMIMARLTHPNIVKVQNFGRFGRSFFIAMEYLSGPTLQTVMRAGGPLDVKTAISYTLGILSGLEAIHEAGVIHRDLKPGNVKLCSGGRVVLFDFGISMVEDMDPLTRSGAFVGTLKYAAPEQINAGPIGAATDMHAAGVILYELLTGNLPYKGESEAVLLYRLLSDPPLPMSGGLEDIPPALAQLVTQLLEKEPERRPSLNATRSCLEDLR